jgi:TolB-like protein
MVTYPEGIKLVARHSILVDSAKVRELRAEKGWARKELAERSKLSMGTIEGVENGGKKYRLETVTRLAEAFRVPIEALLKTEPSLAVLPFANLTGDEDKTYIGEGLAIEIRNRLAVPGFKVIALDSTFAAREKKLDTRGVGKELNAQTVLEGYVSGSGKVMRVMAQLKSATDRRHLWSEHYERRIEDVFGLSEEVARAVSDRLGQRPPALARGTKNESAKHEFLRGRHHFGFKRLSPKDIRLAESHFRRAIRLDPAYSEAYAQLASLHHARAILGLKPARETMPLAREPALKAVSLNSHEPEAHAVLAAIAGSFDYDWEKALRHCRLALAHDPTTWTRFACAYLVLLPCRRFDDAIKTLRQALSEDLLSPLVRLALISTYSARGDYGLAMKHLQDLFEIQDDYWPAYWCRGLIYWADGEEKKAVEAWNQCVRLKSSYPPLFGCWQPFTLLPETRRAASASSRRWLCRK